MRRSRVWVIRALGVVVGLIATAYAGALVYLKVNEAALVFHLEPRHGALPAPAASLHLPYRLVNFETSDSVRLSAWVIPAAHADSSGMWILLCHGQGGDVSTTARPAYDADLRALGVNILAFDWRGFGASQGTPSEAGLYRDATAAYDYLRMVWRVPPARIVIYGHSLGTGPAIELATREPGGRPALSQRGRARRRVGGCSVPCGERPVPSRRTSHCAPGRSMI